MNTVIFWSIFYDGLAAYVMKKDMQLESVQCRYCQRTFYFTNVFSCGYVCSYCTYIKPNLGYKTRRVKYFYGWKVKI